MASRFIGVCMEAFKKIIIIWSWSSICNILTNNLHCAPVRLCVCVVVRQIFFITSEEGCMKCFSLPLKIMCRKNQAKIKQKSSKNSWGKRSSVQEKKKMGRRQTTEVFEPCSICAQSHSFSSNLVRAWGWVQGRSSEPRIISYPSWHHRGSAVCMLVGQRVRGTLRKSYQTWQIRGVQVSRFRRR